MKRYTILLFAFFAGIAACSKEEIKYTGNLVVSAGSVTTYSGAPITQVSVGLFDVNVLITGKTYPSYALEIKSFQQGGKIEFLNINPGNYVVSIVYGSNYKPIQVKVGQTVTVNIFK